MVQAMRHGSRRGPTTRDVHDGVVRAYRRHGLLLYHPRGVRRRDEMAKELGDAGEEAITQARASGEVLKCLLVRCLQSRNLFAHVVPQKGDDEDHYCAKWLSQTLSG